MFRSGTEEQNDEKDRLLQEVSDLSKEKPSTSKGSEAQMGEDVRRAALEGLKVSRPNTPKCEAQEEHEQQADSAEGTHF